MTMDSSESRVIARTINLPGLLASKSYFLLGPRQTGKSFLIRQTLPGVRVFDLLDSPTYLALSRNPERIAEELTERDKVVVIDEVQRLPHLLNEVHRLIEARRRSRASTAIFDDEARASPGFSWPDSISAGKN
jgi:predicted AAA+ superfamily ATPase